MITKNGSKKVRRKMFSSYNKLVMRYSVPDITDEEIELYVNKSLYI